MKKRPFNKLTLAEKERPRLAHNREYAHHYLVVTQEFKRNDKHLLHE